MKRWKRPLRHLVIFGLLGVAMSYAVAWGLTFFDWETSRRIGTSPTKSPAGYWSVSLERTIVHDEVHSAWGAKDAFAWGWSRESVADVLPSWCGRETFPRNPTWDITSPPGKLLPAQTRVVRMGWPLRCVQCECTYTFTRTKSGSVGQGEMKGAFRFRYWKDDVVQKVLGTWEILLPFDPLWPGLLLNTAFYGGILWLLWFGPGMIRRGVRRRRGLCARCGYDLRGATLGGRGSAPCPECGGVSR